MEALREITENLVIIANFQSKIRTEDLLNRNLKLYRNTASDIIIIIIIIIIMTCVLNRELVTGLKSTSTSALKNCVFISCMKQENVGIIDSSTS
jgi:hypothetical protein